MTLPVGTRHAIGFRFRINCQNYKVKKNLQELSYVLKETMGFDDEAISVRN
jgi:hypothetical protein